MTRDADRIIGLYQRHAQAWVNARHARFLEKTWIDRFIGLLPHKPQVLDIGCGSGHPIGRYLMENDCNLTGVDTSQNLLDIAKTQNAKANWILGDMRTLQLDQQFDGILAWHSSFHLTPDDQRRMFPVFRHHAADGAILMFTSGPSAGVAMGTFEGEPLYHASLAPDDYRSLLTTNGFEVIENAVETPDAGGATLWHARFRGE